MINVYAPSGTNKKKEREEFFREKLIYYLRGNCENLILGGDFNCVISPRDVSSGNDSLVSKALMNLIKQVGFKDITKGYHKLPEYTYVKHNYGSRLDRIYVKKFFDNIHSWSTVPVSLSDHNMVLFKLNVKNMKTGKGFWRLNTRILNEKETEENFTVVWSHIIAKKSSFENLILWWDYVKKNVESFLSKCLK